MNMVFHSSLATKCNKKAVCAQNTIKKAACAQHSIKKAACAQNSIKKATCAASRQLIQQYELWSIENSVCLKSTDKVSTKEDFLFYLIHEMLIPCKSFFGPEIHPHINPSQS